MKILNKAKIELDKITNNDLILVVNYGVRPREYIDICIGIYFLNITYSYTKDCIHPQRALTVQHTLPRIQVDQVSRKDFMMFMLKSHRVEHEELFVYLKRTLKYKNLLIKNIVIQ